MAKGYKCPTCGRNTLQYDAKNWFECSQCGTRVPKEHVDGAQ